MLRYLVVMSVALGLGGCRETLPPVSAARYAPLTQADVTATAQQLSELRGLKILEPPRVDFLDGATFGDAVVAKYGPRRQFSPGEEALAALFGMLPPTATGALRETGDGRVAKERVGGFYDTRGKIVRMPNEEPSSREENVRHRATLAHELHHVMQFQNFQEPALADEDARLAWQALVEGDAEVAEMVHTAAELGISASRMLRRARYAVAKPEPVSADATPTERSAWEMLPLASEAMAGFPYRDGLAFSVDLYRAGGFTLIDKAYGRPPNVTEHILHPEKYLADEQPRAISELSPPPGWTLAWSTPLGELRTRVALEPCLGQKVAVAAAAGWNGDRAFVLERDNGWMLGWVSAWDSEADAAELEDGLARMGSCMRANDAAGKPISAQFSIRRVGSVVAFARGGEQADRSATLELLLPLPGAAPRSSPISTMKVPPLREPPVAAGGGHRSRALPQRVFRTDGGGGPLPCRHMDARGDQLEHAEGLGAQAAGSRYHGLLDLARDA